MIDIRCITSAEQAERFVDQLVSGHDYYEAIEAYDSMPDEFLGAGLFRAMSVAHAGLFAKYGHPDDADRAARYLRLAMEEAGPDVQMRACMVELEQGADQARRRLGEI